MAKENTPENTPVNKTGDVVATGVEKGVVTTNSGIGGNPLVEIPVVTYNKLELVDQETLMGGLSIMEEGGLKPMNLLNLTDYLTNPMVVDRTHGSLFELNYVTTGSEMHCVRNGPAGVLIVVHPYGSNQNVNPYLTVKNLEPLTGSRPKEGSPAGGKKVPLENILSIYKLKDEVTGYGEGKETAVSVLNYEQAMESFNRAIPINKIPNDPVFMALFGQNPNRLDRLLYELGKRGRETMTATYNEGTLKRTIFESEKLGYTLGIVHPIVLSTQNPPQVIANSCIGDSAKYIALSKGK